MNLFSAKFVDGGKLPRQCGREDGNISPPLRWFGAPPNAKSFVVLAKESGGSHYHWAAYDIPPHHVEALEGAGTPEGFEDFRHAVNDYGHFGYGGPSPAHRALRFTVRALSCADLPLRTHPTCAEVEKESRKHILAEASITGYWAERAAS
jgi:phosphatidylethanolamine-binding protein (PEBP) family uncharacterized protein